MKNRILTLMMVLLVLFVPGAFAVYSGGVSGGVAASTVIISNNQEMDAGLTPDSPFYFMDRLGESLSVAFTFGNEKKAQKYLEFAQERLEEMQMINNTEKILKLQNNFENNLNKSQEKADLTYIDDKISQLRARNQEVLNELKERLPEQAQKGIDNAIERSKGVHIYSEQEKVQNRITNQNMMMNKFLKEFEGKSFEIQIGDLEETRKVEHNYYYIENNEYRESSSIINNPDYVIKIKDRLQAQNLYQRYMDGDVITYNEVTEVFDVPLKLQGRLVSILGLGGLN